MEGVRSFFSAPSGARYFICLALKAAILLIIILSALLTWFPFHCVMFIFCSIVTLCYFNCHLLLPILMEFGTFLTSNVKKKKILLEEGLLCTYLEYGTPDTSEVSILFLHGYSGSAFDFLMYLPHLNQKRQHMIFLNLLNHWDTCYIRKDIKKDDMLDYIHKFIVKSCLNERKFHMVGFSLGGCMSCHYASRFPQRVLSIFLINPYGFVDKVTDADPSFIFNTYKDGIITFKSTDEFVIYYNYFMNGAMSLPNVFYTLVRYYKNNTSVKEGYVLRGLLRENLSLVNEQVLNDLSGIDVMYVQGGKDNCTTKEGLDYFSKEFPSGSSYLIEEGSHLMLYTHTSTIASLLVRWLEKSR